MFSIDGSEWEKVQGLERVGGGGQCAHQINEDDDMQDSYRPNALLQLWIGWTAFINRGSNTTPLNSQRATCVMIRCIDLQNKEGGE
jgi:hypothetical protein